jgi:hypothetical protein
MAARMDASVRLRLYRKESVGLRSRERPRMLRPIAPGKAKSSAPLGHELSGGIFFARGLQKCGVGESAREAYNATAIRAKQ